MRQYLMFTLISLAAFPVLAEQPLMKLFYTPAERAEIDASRLNEKDKNTSNTASRTPRIEMKGYVKRNGKPDVVFVNDKNTLESSMPLSDVRVVRVQKQGNVKVRIEGKGTVKLKPGEVYTRSEQKITEAYEK